MGPMDPPWQSSELPQLPASSHFSGQAKLCIFVTASMGRMSGILWVRQPLGLGLTEMMALAGRQVNKIPVSPSPGGVCAVMQLQGFGGMQKFFLSAQYSEGTSGGQLHQPSAQSWALLNYICEWQSLHRAAVSASGCPSQQHQGFVSKPRGDAASKEHSQFSKSKHICPTALPITPPGWLEGR